MYILNFRRYKYLVFCIHFIFYYAEVAVQKIARNPLSDTILHFESLEYDRAHLLSSHSRVRRSLDNNAELRLNFKAHNRQFYLRLKRDITLFTHDLFVDGDSFNPSDVYEGHLKGEPLSSVHGFVYDGIFEGRIYCEDGNQYFIESAKQYKHLDHNKTHSVIYSGKDVVHRDHYRCGGIKARTKHANTNSSLFLSHLQDSNKKLTFTGSYNHSRTRRAVSNGKPKTECHLFVRADPTYVTYANGRDRAMLLMSQHVKKVSNIYKATDFNNDPSHAADGYTLHIKRMELIDTTGCTSTIEPVRCRFKPEYIGVEKFLDNASLEDHHLYCLSYVFSHRDFSDGVLGLAWIGDTDGAGGICDGYQAIGSVMKSLNTGIVSNLNYGKTVPIKVTDITLAHEIGHNFGSQHDPTSGQCAPGGRDGNYIMYPRATSGTDVNNKKFSTCSKAAIWDVLQVKADRCFKEKGEPICGNRVVEPGEDCDCGYYTDPSCKSDQCCHGAYPDGRAEACKFTNKANLVPSNLRCSSSQGLCCDVAECKPYPNQTKKCADKNDCAQESMCIDSSHQCPQAPVAPNKTICNEGKNTCLNGECTGSLCLTIDKEDCQCSEKENLCKVCCQDKNQNNTCAVFKKDDKIVTKPPGSPCDQYLGYCDVLYQCRKVDAEGPLSRLKKWLFSSKSFATILDWMRDHWWACVLIGLGLVLFMAGFIACCSVHTPSSNPSKPQHRTLSQTLSRRGRRSNPRPTAPRGSNSDAYNDPPPGYETATRESRNPGLEMRYR